MKLNMKPFLLSVLLFLLLPGVYAEKIAPQSLKPSRPDDFLSSNREFIAPFELVGSEAGVGRRRVSGFAPKGFEEFVCFYVEYLKGQEADHLTPDKQGVIPVTGQVLVRTESSARTEKGKLIKFAISKIVVSDCCVKLNFTSKKFKGIYYIFEGQYFDTGKVYPSRDSIRLEGTLIKMEKGFKLAEAEVSLYPRIGDVD